MCSTCWLYCSGNVSRTNGSADGWVVCPCFSPLKPFINAVAEICGKQALAGLTVMSESSLWSNSSGRTYPLPSFPLPLLPLPTSSLGAMKDLLVSPGFDSASADTPEHVPVDTNELLQLKPTWICETIGWWLCLTSVWFPFMHMIMMDHHHRYDGSPRMDPSLWWKDPILCLGA